MGRAPLGLRAWGSEDLTASLDLLVTVHEHDNYPLVWPADPARWVSGAGALAVVVAEVDDVLVGQVSLREASGVPCRVWEAGTGLAASRLGVVSRLFVHPAHRRLGVATALLSWAVDEARRRELHAVLDVLARSAGACRLYEALGWQRIGEFIWPLPDGSREPAYAYTVAVTPSR